MAGRAAVGAQERGATMKSPPSASPPLRGKARAREPTSLSAASAGGGTTLGHPGPDRLRRCRPPKRSALSALGRRTQEPPISWLMNLTLSRPDIISLAAGFTDRDTLPVAETRQLLGEVLRSRKRGEPALQYGSTSGLPELRQRTAERLRKQDGAPSGDASPYRAERLLMTNGSQQLLYLVSEALCDPGDIVLVEDPTYFVFLGIAQSHGLRCRGIRLESDGLDLKHLESRLAALKRSGELSRVKALYLVSYFQNPTGLTTSFAKKVGALEVLRHYERAAGHPIYLLEDAAYRELRFAGPDVPSALAATGFAHRVIYAGTFSKPFATGVRVGFGLLPPALLPVIARIKGSHDFGSASLLQHLLARALATCRYDGHLATLRERYARKAQVMAEAIRRHFPPGVAWCRPSGGLYVWAKLPAHTRTGPRSKFFKRALAQNVLYVPGLLCYADDPARAKPDCELRLSFGGATLSDIRTGIARLGKVLGT